MFRIKREEKFSDSNVWSSRLLPKRYFSKGVAMSDAKMLAFRVSPFHPSYYCNVYGNDSGYWVEMPYGRRVVFSLEET